MPVEQPARSRGFPPIAAADARVLILGTLPGVESLRQQRYYAHPRNAFWPIMAAVLGFAADGDYPVRAAALRAAGIALWDVCRAAHRPGSLDSAIDVQRAQPNDLRRFLHAHPQIAGVLFNGQAAAGLYRRLVQSRLTAAQRELPSLVLPSTSPAYATLGLRDKRRRWARALASYIQ